MTRELIGALLILIVPFVAGLSFLSVKKTKRSQELELTPPLLPKSDPGFSSTGFYVSTVFADRPLAKVWGYGLGSRGRCDVQVGVDGISIYRKGERNLFIPESDVVRVGRSSATIDKGVEPGGLVTISWNLGASELATHIRFANTEIAADLIQTITSKLGASFE